MRRSACRTVGLKVGVQQQVQRGLLLDVVVGQCAASRSRPVELLAREEEALLVGWDALLVLDLGLDVLNRIAALHLQRDGLAVQDLDEDRCTRGGGPWHLRCEGLTQP